MVPCPEPDSTKKQNRSPLNDFEKLTKYPFDKKLKNNFSLGRSTKILDTRNRKNQSWFCIQSTCNQLRLIVNLIIRKTSIAINYRNTIWMICDCFCNICHKSSFYYFLQHPEARNLKKTCNIRHRATKSMSTLMVQVKADLHLQHFHLLNSFFSRSRFCIKRFRAFPKFEPSGF